MKSFCQPEYFAAMRWLVLLALTFGGCKAILRVKGAQPQQQRPGFEEIIPPSEEYKVWVLVPEVKVNTYPQADGSQQPMLQFTGDKARLDQGWGSMTMLVAPDQFHDGERVTYFADRILWTDRLLARDRRRFSFWLRENNRSAPTRFDRKVEQVDRVAEVVEEISSLSGFKLPARRAVDISAQAFKELQQDWLIMQWTCPWQHLLEAAKKKLAGEKSTVLLRTRIVSAEMVKGKAVAEVVFLFVVQRLASPLPPAIAR